MRFSAWDRVQDYADSNSVISFYSSGGLGLPERDYYTRTDAKSWSSGSSMSRMWQRCFLWRARRMRKAAKDAETVLAIETRLAKASLTITEQRDPQNLNHPTDVAGWKRS
jgi:putative endopeptidase